MYYLPRGSLAATPLLAALCGACGVDAGAAPASATTQAVSGVPAPPVSPNQRIGAYVSPADTSGYVFPDLVNGPAGLVSQLGARVVRVFLSNPDKFTGVPYGSLDTEVQSGPYPQLFSSPSFDTYLLTAYGAADNPANGCAPDWLDGLSPGAAQAETAELAQLARTLHDRYPQKQFILINWEGDSAIGALAHYCGVAQTDAMWQGFTDWINARVQGVLEARAQGASNVFSGVEFNALYRAAGDDYYGNQCAPVDANNSDPSCAPCDDGHRCVISRVIPNVPGVDYISYSAWQSLAIGDDGAVGQRLQNDLSAAQARVPGAQHANFVVGELGADRFAWGPDRAAARVTAAVTALSAWGASYGVYWQILDNPGGGPGNGFGAYEPTGTLGATGQALHAMFAPTIGGVVDDTDGVVGTAHLGGFVSIYGTNYGASNTISIAGVAATTSYNGATQVNAIVSPSTPLGIQTLQLYNPASDQSAFATVDVLP